MPREHRYFVDTLTGRHNGVTYIGMTSDLLRRLDEHRRSAVEGFTSRYNVARLVYLEQTPDVFAALSRESEVEKWRREKNDALVVAANPQWRDLATELL